LSGAETQGRDNTVCAARVADNGVVLTPTAGPKFDGGYGGGATRVGFRPTEVVQVSSARHALDIVMDALSEVVAPFDLKVVERDQVDDTPAVNVRVISLDRRGRSRRDGSLLDLVLAATVITTGPARLEAVERMLSMIEQDQRLTAAALTAERQPPSGLGFLLTMTVSVRLDEPSGQQVTETLRIDTRLVRTLSGTLVDSRRQAISGAQLRTADDPTPVRSGADGHFALLTSAQTAETELLVTVRGTTTSFAVRPDEIPLIVQWPG
jgi:hypothetical protein